MIVKTGIKTAIKSNNARLNTTNKIDTGKLPALRSAVKQNAIIKSAKKLGQKATKIESSVFNKQIDKNNTYDNGSDIVSTSKKATDKSIATSKKTISNVSKRLKKKHKKKIEKSAKKAVKSTARTAKKATVKVTSAATRASARAAQQAARTAARGTVKLSTKIVAKALAAIKALAASPVGLVVLGVAGGVILILVIMSNFSSAAVSTVAGPLNSISWLWGGNNSLSQEELVQIIDMYADKSTYLLETVKSNALNDLDEIEIDEYDIITYNGAVFFPANSALSDVEVQIENSVLSRENLIYILSVANVYKQKLKQIAEGLEPNDIPQPMDCIIYDNDLAAIMGLGTGSYPEMKSFFAASVAETNAGTCPGSDCCTRYCKNKNHCVTTGGTCQGHKYCDNSHVNIVVDFQMRQNLEDYLSFSEAEKGRVKLSVDMLTEMINSIAPGGTTE